VFHHYRRLIALRHDDPVVALGDFTMLLPDDESVYAFTRALDGVALLVLGNFTGDERAVSLESWVPDELGDLVLGNYADVPDGEIVLRPWEALVYRRVRTAGA
jgi:oligo-1,6-glucosidase